MKRQQLIAGILGILCLNLSYLEANPIQDFLESALNDPKVRHEGQKSKILRSISDPLWIHGAELGVTSTGLNTPNKFNLKLSLPAWGQNSNLKKLHQLQLRKANRDQKIALLASVQKRYSLLLQLYKIQEDIKLNKQLQIIFQDKITVLNSKASAGIFSMGQLLKTEDELNQINNQHMQLHLEKKRIQTEMAHLNQGKKLQLPLLSSSFPSVLAIAKRLNHLTKIRNLDSNIFIQKEKENLFEAEAKLEQADILKYKYLDSLSLGFTPETKGDNFSISLGISLPFASINRHQVIRQKLNVLNAKNSILTMEQELINHQQKLIDQINAQIELYKQRKKVNHVETTSKYLKLHNKPDTDPDLLLAMREIGTKKSQRLLNLKVSILFKYIDLLNLNSELIKRPLKNYLSKQMEDLES